MGVPVGEVGLELAAVDIVAMCPGRPGWGLWWMFSSHDVSSWVTMWLLVPGTQICAYGSVLMAFWGTYGPIPWIPMAEAGLMAMPRTVYFVGPHNGWQTTSQTQKARTADGFWKVEKARKYSPLKPLLKHLTTDHNKQENSKRNGNTRLPYLPPEKPVCRWRSSRTGHETLDWFKLRKGL